MVQGVGYSGSGYYPRKKKEDNTTKVVLGTLITAAAVAAGAYYCGRHSINEKSYITPLVIKSHLPVDEFKWETVGITVDKKGRILTSAGKVLKSKKYMSNIGDIKKAVSAKTDEEVGKLSDVAKEFRSYYLIMPDVQNNAKVIEGLTWYEKFYNFVNKSLNLGIYKEGKVVQGALKGWNA